MLKQHVYSKKEVLLYFDIAYKIEADYYKMAIDHPVRMAWWEIKSLLEHFDKKSQQLFRLFYEGFTGEEIAIEWNTEASTIYQLKYELVNHLVILLNFNEKQREYYLRKKLHYPKRTNLKNKKGKSNKKERD
ncbi:hypothetical protein [Cytobacillus firmus]|uniref:hypothetical protein n=1 Tax=Cytobacillus firmus TaxID=1399 RepID=UPI0018CED917|nr:hypothetical protein [Cytobacillus firmus]MBG9657072.1 hypothetical protein [Cytobacillus firmus]MED1906745.1 hypothetical protein [Cytobacillus firmus]